VGRILEGLPKSLDGTYERVLKEIRMANRTHAHRLLQCLVAAVRPLRVEELAEVIAFDFNTKGTPGLYPGWRWEDQEEAVLSACSSLVIIVKDGHSRIVQFSHFSVKEFLTSKRLAELDQDVSRYYIRRQPAHVVLARACLGVLLQLDDHIDEDSIKNFPLASYAAEHWYSHARVGRVSSHIKDGMQRLFNAEKPHFAAWLRIHNPDRFGRTFEIRLGTPEARPLYYAARLGFQDLVRHLVIKYPGDVNASGGWDGTPLHAALSEGHIEVSRLLLKSGADVNIQDIWEGTPLHHASKRGQTEIGRWLLDSGADANARNGSGWTPLHLAAIHGRAGFARMLLEQEAEVDARGDHGRTALHLAAGNGRMEVMGALLEHGADVNGRDDWERRPSELQCGEKREGVLEILERVDRV
jgi:ankyrin repeat protein